MLVLLRHAESTANVEKRKAGQLDVPLSPHGIEQAKALVEDLDAYKFDMVFTSPSERCQDTTFLSIGARHPRSSFIVIDELVERSGGLLEGRLYADIRKEMAPRNYKKWARDYNSPPPNGESFKDVENRVIPWCRETAFPLHNEGHNVFICSHEITLKVIIGYIKGMDEADIPKLVVDNAVPFFMYRDIRL